MVLSNRSLPGSISVSSCAVFVLFVLIQYAPLGLAQQPTGAKLAKVEFEGRKHLSQEQLLLVSGLEIGQPITVAALDAAAQRLADSGLLKKLSYRFHTVKSEATVTFLIVEAAGLKHPAIFDNFIWFTEDELANAVRHEVPSFDGTVLDDGNMTDNVAHALQLLLAAHKIEGKVEYLPAADQSGNLGAHVFEVRGIKMPICSLHFTGAQNIAEERLLKRSRELLAAPYSRQFIKEFVTNNLVPLYREVGQLRATFAQSVAEPQTTETCKDGADVTIPVDEGIIYSWANSEWSGHRSFDAKELDKALQMEPGEVANGIKFDKGLEAVRQLYGRKGYLTASLKPIAVFDDQARKVEFRIDVKEGPQYRMGNIIVKGLPDNQTNYLRGKWEILKNDVYDAGYYQDFLKSTFREILRTIVEERQAQGKPRPEVSTNQQLNRATLTVDVTFEFTEKKEQ